MEKRLMGHNEWITPIADGKELFEFIDGKVNYLQISLEEAITVMRYLEARGFEIGCKGEDLLCCECCQEEKSDWLVYSVDDLINDAYDFNEDMIRQTIEGLNKAADDQSYENLNIQLDKLRKDEEILDKVYDRTKYGIQLDRLENQLAEQCILVVKRGQCLEEIDRELGNILGDKVKTSLYAEIKNGTGKAR